MSYYFCCISRTKGRFKVVHSHEDSKNYSWPAWSRDHFLVSVSVSQ